ncbi:MAG: LemA family protein [Candidatus Eisenbacteria bacterium]
MHIGETMGLALLLFVGLGLSGYLLTLYNGMVALKQNVGRAWANIDVLLKQRHDEIPKLVRTVEGYMQHERAIFDKLSDARGALLNAKSVPQRAEAEGLISSALGRLFAVAESYPDLKANQSFLQLQARISDIENQIADRREFYNDTVTTFNTRLEQLPDKYVGQWLNYTSAELYKVFEADKQDVEIRFRMAG